MQALQHSFPIVNDKYIYPSKEYSQELIIEDTMRYSIVEFLYSIENSSNCSTYAYSIV